MKLSLRAQRSNLVNGKGLLRRCAPRNDRLKGSLSVKLLQSHLVSFEGLAKSDIVSFCTRTGTSRWRPGEGLRKIGTRNIV